MENLSLSLKEQMKEVEDPRKDRTKEHQLLDILIIAICGIICGADGWVQVEAYGKSKKEFLSKLLELKNGIPSHDTFGRVFAALDPAQLRSSFLKWIEGVAQVTGGEVIAIDGKALRRAYDEGGEKKGFIYMVSAWANSNHLVLGQRKVDEKSNEITAIPKLLEILSIRDCIVTIDAMGCQKEIAEKIQDKEADYVLALKGNQKELYEGTQFLFSDKEERDCDYHKTIDKNHGRVETRECWVMDDIEALCRIAGKEKWKGLTTIIKIRSTRIDKEKTTTEERYYLSSLDKNAEKALGAVRSHWGIENKLHWCLDVGFREDECRVRQGNAAENLSILRHIAINLLNQEKTRRYGIQSKRLAAGWDDKYLLKILSI